MDKQIDKQKAIEAAMSQIDKQFGKGSVMKMGERPQMDIEAVSTGALSLDLALGVGGLPRGRVTEIYGPESSGKSTRSEEHTSELQSPDHLVCRLLLEKKKQITYVVQSKSVPVRVQHAQSLITAHRAY